MGKQSFWREEWKRGAAFGQEQAEAVRRLIANAAEFAAA